MRSDAQGMACRSTVVQTRAVGYIGVRMAAMSDARAIGVDVGDLGGADSELLWSQRGRCCGESAPIRCRRRLVQDTK